MSERTIDPSRSANDKRVYVGALIPLRHYTLLVEEAEQANVSRSEVLRWALDRAIRRGEQQQQSIAACGRSKEQGGMMARRFSRYAVLVAIALAGPACPVRIPARPGARCPPATPAAGLAAGHARPARDRPGQDPAGHLPGRRRALLGRPQGLRPGRPLRRRLFHPLWHSRHRSPQRRHHRLRPRPDPGQPDGQPGPVRPLPPGPPLLAGPQAGLLPAGCHLGHRHPGLPAERAGHLHRAGDLARRPLRAGGQRRVHRRHPRLLAAAWWKCCCASPAPARPRSSTRA